MMDVQTSKDENENTTKKVLEYVTTCQQFSPGNVDYQYFTDTVKELSGAAIVALNLVSEQDQNKTVVKAVSGALGVLSRLMNASGYNAVGTEWEVKYEEVQKREKNRLIYFSSFKDIGYEDAFPRIAFVYKIIETFMKPEGLYTMEFEYQGEFLGIMTLIMPKNKTLEYKEQIELYINQIAGTIQRLRAENKLQQKVKALEESEAMFKAYLQKSPLGIFTADHEGRYTGVNRKICEMSGHTEEELLNLNILDFLAPQFIEKGMKIFERFQAEDHAEEDIMARRKNGETYWIHLTAVRINNQAVAFCQDITERKESEERAKELNCLHSFSRLLQQENNNLDKILEETAALLPHSFQYPEDTGTCITYKGREFITKNYKETPWKISSQLKLYGEQTGTIEVCYRKPPLHEQEPFSQEETLMLGTIAEHLSRVTEQIQAEESLNYQFSFEKMLAEVSSIFATLPSDQLEQSLNVALEQIGEFFQVERSYVFQFSEDGKQLNNTYEWCAEGTEAQIDRLQRVPTDAFPWYVEQIKNKKNVIITDVDGLPPEVEAEKKLLKPQDIKSLVSIPMMNNGIVFGFLGIDAVKEKKSWTENQVMLLTVVTELVSNAFSRNMAEEKVRYQSLHDGLTGLYNRFFLEKEMERLDTERQLPIGIIMVDLNGFKMVNDTFGHDVGDEMLQQAADIFRKSCRSEDLIARWGGDEFVIFLPQTAEENAKAICQRIEGNCRKNVVKNIPISMAMGYAIKENANKDLTEILKEAEEYMYKHKLAESQRAKSAVLNVRLKELETKSFEPEDHYTVMQKVAHIIGKKKGLSPSEFDKLKKLISMHDIGKVKIPEEILTKKGPLTDEEWEIVKRHPETGYMIARATEEFAQVAEDILSHHEHWDGSGYPQGLKGNEIPILARITAIADAYEVMSTGRAYKEALPEGDVIAELKRCAGFQFDPELVEIFLLLRKDA